jgi:preprotein translocase subunit SecE
VAGKAQMAENKSMVENIRQWPVEVKDYFHDLAMEMRHVTWPSRSQVRATTVVVIVTVFAFAAYFAVVDSLFTRVIARLFQVFTKQS